MATGNDLVNGALRKLGIKPSDSAITGQEMLDGIEELNDMLSEWSAGGIQIGFSRIADPADVVRIPIGAEACVKNHLAARLASDYSKQITPALINAMTSSMMALLRITQPPITVQYPDTLPMGAGNECNDIADTQRFFNENDEVNF